MMVDPAGRYSIQIFRRGRPSFASGEKARGEPDEYRSAVLGASTHFGRVHLDAAAPQLLVVVEAASCPTAEGTRHVRTYT